MKIYSALFFLLFIFFLFLIRQAWQLPEELNRMIELQNPLPNYVEAGYSPLGRSPVVDAVLGDPFYYPVYAKLVSKRLKEASKSNHLHEVYATAMIAGGIPVYRNNLKNRNYEVKPTQPKTDFPGCFGIYPGALITTQHKTPSEFHSKLGAKQGTLVYFLWRNFIHIYQESEELLSALSSEEKEWIRQNVESFFFGEEKSESYDFFTTDSKMPLKFFEMASRVDIARLANLADRLALIVDCLYEQRDQISAIHLSEDFVWEEEGKKLIISDRSNTQQHEDADFYISLGSNNTFYNNAGGTKGVRAASLFVDTLGHNTFSGKQFIQGSGILGVGVLASFRGGNKYSAQAFSQGTGFFGSGILMNLGGSNHYEIDFFGQSSALFGTSLLWNKGGNSSFIALEGMAQAVSSTLGVAFLVENAGNDTFVSGISGEAGKRSSGMGQGASIGVRANSWIENPSFYGGTAFLYNGGGNNAFQTSWFGQGSAYFLGAGTLVVEGGNNTFKADVDSQGQGLHLAAGLMLVEGSHNHFDGGWGSLGVGADRSAGIFINTGGNNDYRGTVQTLGTARKPKALGLFIGLEGNNTYHYERLSNGDIQRPQSPLEWPKALFLQFGGNNIYSSSHGGRSRWGVDGHSIGLEISQSDTNLPELLFQKLPVHPRVGFPFDPVHGWAGNGSHQPLEQITNDSGLENVIRQISESDYDQRRMLYESIDLYKSKHPTAKIDVSFLLKNPERVPEDQFNYAARWAIFNRTEKNLDQVVRALEKGTIISDYARKMAIILVARERTPRIASLFAKMMMTDPSEENRAFAVRALGSFSTPQALEFLQIGLTSPHETVRYGAAKGLQGTSLPGTWEVIQPLLQDDSFYVRRAAAMTAISLHHKEGIPVLLETLNYDTLDTEENYGDNIYNALSKYVGVNLGVDKKAWIDWWNREKDNFEFPAIEAPPKPKE